MKKGIHPNYITSNVKCACGNSFETKSTKEEIFLEVCAACHPFYTGKQTSASRKGKVEQFNAKYGRTSNNEA